jgi:hypothetical protein
MPRAMRNAANQVSNAAGQVGWSADAASDAVVNFCSWGSILMQRISAGGINVRLKKTEEGVYALNISVPTLPKETSDAVPSGS